MSCHLKKRKMNFGEQSQLNRSGDYLGDTPNGEEGGDTSCEFVGGSIPECVLPFQPKKRGPTTEKKQWRWCRMMMSF